MAKMKAITIWQPWASLLAHGVKQYETRSWATSYRGPIAIHAAAREPRKCFDALDLDGVFQVAAALRNNGVVHKDIPIYLVIPEIVEHDLLPTSAVIATAELAGCHRIVLHGGRGLSSASPGWLETDHGIYEPTDQELFFGDWAPGRYAWEITNIKLLDTPVPAKGKQGLWNWEPGEKCDFTLDAYARHFSAGSTK